MSTRWASAVFAPRHLFKQGTRGGQILLGDLDAGCKAARIQAVDGTQAIAQQPHPHTLRLQRTLDDLRKQMRSGGQVHVGDHAPILALRTRVGPAGSTPRRRPPEAGRALHAERPPSYSPPVSGPGAGTPHVEEPGYR